MIKLFVGLGNPGPEYEHTRHNAGFWWVDALAASQRVAFRAETRFQGEAAKVVVAGQDLLLLKPLLANN